MCAIEFLLDENVDRKLVRATRRPGLEVTVRRVGEPGSPPLGTLDPEILAWCEDHGFSLVTNNRASMPGHLRDHLAAGRHVPGIFILNPGMSVEETVAQLLLLHGASVPSEFDDQVSFLPVA